MKKFLMAVVIVVLMICAGGWFFTYQSLGVVQGTLQSTQISLNDVRTKLQNTAISLTETQQKLQDTDESLKVTQQELLDTNKSLEETQQRLVEQKTQATKYIQLYESGLQELQNKAEELSRTQQERQKLQKELEETKKELELNKDALGARGIQVYSDVIPPYRSGNSTELALVNNSSAINPTWEQLKAFLLEDRTDKKLYIIGVYECGNFARDLHNNAEVKGIRSAFVALHFSSGVPHALNAFKTLDMGLVYIDVTGELSMIGLQNLDRIAQVKKGQSYRTNLIFPDGWVTFDPPRIVEDIEIYW